MNAAYVKTSLGILALLSACRALEGPVSSGATAATSDEPVAIAAGAGGVT